MMEIVIKPLLSRNHALFATRVYAEITRRESSFRRPGRRKKFISPCQTDATSAGGAERRERISRRIYRRVGAVCPVISAKT
jgi:hypothetical protein